MLLALPLSTVSNGVEHGSKYASFLNCDLFGPQTRYSSSQVVENKH